jgi:hypothetical protein
MPFKVEVENVSHKPIYFSKGIVNVFVAFKDNRGLAADYMNNFYSLDEGRRTLADLCVLRPGESIKITPYITWPHPRSGSFTVWAEIGKSWQWNETVAPGLSKTAKPLNATAKSATWKLVVTEG